MDKNEYNLKLQEIDRLVDQGNYAAAAAAADQVDWKRVRNVRTLCLISEIYEAENRYDDSKALLLRAYKRSPVGRAILYRLVEVTIKLKQFDEAIEYYSEYVQAAPHDTSKYILKYKIYRGRGSSVEEQIAILREYLDQEYNEKYAYELAKLYQEADRIQECLATCDDLVLWFHSGKYVIKALELKMKYAALTPKQQEIYNHRFDEEARELGAEKQIVTQGTAATVAEEILEDTQRAIAHELAKEELPQDPAPDQEAPPPQAEAKTAEVQPAPEGEKGSESLKEAQPEEVQVEEVQVVAERATGEPLPEAADQLDEPLEDAASFDEQLNRYNTQELQTEMIKSMREIVAGVGLRDLVDENEEAADRLIEASKKAQETPINGENPVSAPRKLTMPKPQEKQDAGQLSIDDILLSMGARGSAVREAAAKAAPAKKPRPEGVLSAVDEALLNMGISPEEIAPKPEKPLDELFKQDPPAARKAHETPEGGEDTQAARTVEAEEVQAAQAPRTAEAEEVQTAQAPEQEDTQTLQAAKTPEPEEAQSAQAAEEALTDSQPAEEAQTAIRYENGADVLENTEATTQKPAASEPSGEQTDPVDEDGVKIAPTPAHKPLGDMEELTDIIAEGAQEGAAAEQELTGDASQDLTMSEIMGAKTRKIPTEEVARRRARMPLSGEEEPQEEVSLEADETKENQSPDAHPGQDKEAAPQQEGASGPGEQIPAPRLWVKPSLRGLFDGYLQVRDMDRQIYEAIDQALRKGADRTSRSGNILIFGGHGCGKTTIATGLAKAIAQERGQESVKMAKIYATDLNRKDIAATIAKIAGGVLIVEEAGDLEDGIADQLTTAMEFRTDGLIIILEDEQRYMHDLLMRHPRMTMKFTSQIYVPPFNTEDLVRFAALYADDRDYSFSEQGAIALHERLDAAAKTQEGSLPITTALDLVDGAIVRANKFGRKLFSGKKRYDAEGRIVLSEKDFK